MYLQRYYVKKDYSITSGAVDTFELPLTAPLAGLTLIWEFTTGAGGSAAVANEALVEVIRDGSRVITSAQYGELVAVNQLFGYKPYRIADLGASTSGNYTVYVPFGFGPADRRYFLDPRGFASLDLRITQPTFATTTTNILTIIAHRLLDGPPAPQGYLKVSTKKEYTAASAVEYITLDRANKYAAILLTEMDGTSTDIESVITHVKLNVDSNVVIPYDTDSDHIIEDWWALSDRDDSGTFGTPGADENFIPLVFGYPWQDESEMLDAPRFGSVVVEATGAGAGSIRVTGVEVVR